MAVEPTTEPLTITEILGAPLFPVFRVMLLKAANDAIEGKIVSVSLTYDKQTASKPRVADRDYIGLPGVSGKAHIGPLTVYRYVDNRGNQKLGRVGKPYFKVNTLTRQTGDGEWGHANMRPEGITEFKVTSIVTPAQQTQNS